MSNKQNQNKQGQDKQGQDNVVKIAILEWSSKIACPPEERKALEQAMALLDDRMNKARESAPDQELTDLAMLVALELANDCLKTEARVGDLVREESGQQDTIGALENRIRVALAAK